MNAAPIFIHSLFRAGSTYLFQVFRRSPSGYCCYQEPLHELTCRARENPSLLLSGDDAEKQVLLRHPPLDRGYFQELHAAWPAWKDALDEPAVYGAYFAPPGADIGVPFWQALIQASPGRAVFQECRTSGRIGAIKDQLGGFHLFLWRNPWDQWWSYKAAPYFDAANRLILGANDPPPAVLPLRERLQTGAIPGKNILDTFTRYESSPLSSSDSYLLFYLLWCLGLEEGLRHADLLVNIDQLSDSAACREKILTRLAGAGIDGLHFNDCKSPQSLFPPQDRAFFEPLEARVHEWLLAGGFSRDALARLLSLRRECEPLAWKAAGTPELAQAGQVSRMRQLARRFEDGFSRACGQRDGLAQDIQRLAALQRKTEDQVAQAHHRLAEALGNLDATHERLTETSQRLTETSQRLTETQQELEATQWARHEFHLLANARAREVAELRASLSWRITRPLRALAEPFMGGGKALAERCIQRAMAKPWLVAVIHACVDCCPPLRAAITRRVSRAMDESSAPAAPELPALQADEPEDSGLPPHARRVHAALAQAIARRHKEQTP